MQVLVCVLFVCMLYVCRNVHNISFDITCLVYVCRYVLICTYSYDCKGMYVCTVCTYTFMYTYGDFKYLYVCRDGWCITECCGGSGASPSDCSANLYRLRGGLPGHISHADHAQLLRPRCLSGQHRQRLRSGGVCIQDSKTKRAKQPKAIE